MSHGAHHKTKLRRDLQGQSVHDANRVRELARRPGSDDIEATMSFEDAKTADGGTRKVSRPDSLQRSLVGGSLI